MKRRLNAKGWVIGFLAIVFIGILGYMITCFMANPEGYFSNAHGLPYFFKDDYSRSEKAVYVLDHKDEIEGVILGGSKCGAVDVDMMKEYTGLNYYNMYLTLGTFKDYLAYTKFLAEKVKVKEIWLILSGYESISYDRTDLGNNYRIPAAVDGNWFDRLKEFLSWAMVDPSTLKRAIEGKKDLRLEFSDSIVDGRRARWKEILAFHRDPDVFAQKMLKKYNKHLATLFSGRRDMTDEVMEQDLEAMRQIMEICERNDVKLQVVFGPCTMTERYRYEGERYYAYMLQMVNLVGEIWDFSDYNDINMNLYNYANYLHYDLEVADLMINTLFGKEYYEGFGRILTPDNIWDAIGERRADFLRLQEEFERTGTVKLGGMDDEGYLPWRTEWVSSKAAQAEMQKYWDRAVTGETLVETESE